MDEEQWWKTRRADAVPFCLVQLDLRSATVVPARLVPLVMGVGWGGGGGGGVGGGGLGGAMHARTFPAEPNAAAVTTALITVKCVFLVEGPCMTQPVARQTDKVQCCQIYVSGGCGCGYVRMTSRLM